MYQRTINFNRPLVKTLVGVHVKAPIIDDSAIRRINASINSPLHKIPQGLSREEIVKFIESKMKEQ